MKTKIYNNLIFSLLFVCSIFFGLFGGVGVFAQGGGEQSPTTLNPKTSTVTKEKTQTLYLYSTIFGEDQKIVASSGDREAVSRTVQGIFGRIFSVIFTVAGIIMVLMLAVHGTRMIYAEFNGNVPVFSDAKDHIKKIAFGSAVLLLSWVVLDFIDPNLLRPRLFQTITQLSEVGQGAELYSDQIEIPKGGVNFDTSGRTVTITRCPEVDTRFGDQLTDLEESLRGERKYFHQILYSKFGKSGVYVYDEEGVGVKYLACSNGKVSDSPITLPPTTEIVAVFPIVAIEVKEDRKVVNSQTSDSKSVRKKTWRGKPKRYQVPAGTILTELAEQKKEDINLTQDNFSGVVSVGLVDADGGKVSELVYSSAGQIRSSCDSSGEVRSVGGVQIAFGSFQDSVSVDGLTVDEARYVLETNISGIGYEKRTAKNFLTWNKVWYQKDTHIFCLDSNLVGFKVIPQFSTTNSSDFHSGVPTCYQFIKKSGTQRTFEGVRVIDC